MSKTHPVRCLCWLLASWLCVTAGSALAFEQGGSAQSSGDTCGLKIQGKFVDRLVLLDDDNQLIEFSKPGAEVELPAGRYGLYEVYVKDGYRCGRYGFVDEDWFTLSPGHLHEIRIGAPLTPKVEVTRFGRNLTLDYELVDADGRSYRSVDRINPPQFSVCAGHRELVSGSFEHG